MKKGCDRMVQAYDQKFATQYSNGDSTYIYLSITFHIDYHIDFHIDVHIDGHIDFHIDFYSQKVPL